jgi:hypothetical protein
MDIFEIMICMIKHILYVIIIMLIYGIKIIRKMPIILSILKYCSIIYRMMFGNLAKISVFKTKVLQIRCFKVF